MTLPFHYKTRQILLIVPAFFAMLFLAGCNGQEINNNPTPVSLFPTAIKNAPAPPTFVLFQITNTPGGPVNNPPQTTATFNFVRTATPRPPTAIPTLDANWASVGKGVQYRRLAFKDSRGQDVSVLVARIDPASVTFKVKYTPGQVKSINDWAFALPGASLIVNGNYFMQNRAPLGLVSTDGNLFGSNIGRNDSGLFQVISNNPRVRSMYLEPFSNIEHFDQALQGYPLLVAGGQVAPAFNPDLSKAADRRTVIAQDTHGRILVIVTPLSGVTFTDIARWLGVSGLEIDMALNLDGGGSTFMYLQTGGPSQYTPGLSPVPVVLAVYPR